jgi:hypothetical protein
MMRTEYFDIAFIDGRADGWVFGVPERFRDQLDIKYSELVDRKESRKLREHQPRNASGLCLGRYPAIGFVMRRQLPRLRHAGLQATEFWSNRCIEDDLLPTIGEPGEPIRW